jgi:phosphoribosyl-AMP cyclohydrolase
MSELHFVSLGGAVPVVLQDAESDAVLSLGFMNRAALLATLETGKVTLLSGDRARVYEACVASGEPLLVREVRTDCDRDALLVRVRVESDGVICERGAFTCFADPIELPEEPDEAVSA